MPSYRNQRGQKISLIKSIAKSGQGEIWTTNLNKIIAKVYHTPTQEQTDKLKVMLANPPQSSSLAWPIDLLLDNQGTCVGFLMNFVENSEELICSYNNLLRNQYFPHFNWFCLHIIALNIALTLHEIHARDYVVGDIKPANILLNRDDPNISFIDTDSFQVKDKNNNKIYYCPVGTPGFTPPELLGKNFSNVTQEVFHDYFRLGVIIHLLLFGNDPYQSGIWKGLGNPPNFTDLTKQGHWIYGHKSKYKPGPLTIPFNIIHPELQNCFRRCFEFGHKNPKLRPSPQDWVYALEIAINDLTSCNQVNNHIYSKSYGKCYWCDRYSSIQIDVFPSVPKPVKPKQINLNLPPRPPAPIINYQNSSSLWLKIIATISGIATIGLGLFGYQQYQEIKKLQSSNSSLYSQKYDLETKVSNLEANVKNLNGQTSSLNSDVNFWRNKFNQIKSQAESQIAHTSFIIYSGKLQSKGSYNNHIFWVGQQNNYYFSLHDLSGGDADFVILDENYNEIAGTKRSNTGSDVLNSLSLNPGTYYVKVYLYGDNSTSYKMSIYKY